jgi:DNA-binding transcriptional regulator YhcF (GntR family)
MTKYARFSEVIETRIKRGDYVVRELPTESELALELGASRKTARRALQELIGKGIVVRKPYGRLAVNRQHAKSEGRLQLAFLSAAFYSTNVEIWRYAVVRAAERIGAIVRPIDFVHWEDPAISEALERFDGVFLLPNSESIPVAILERFSRASHLVALDNDLSQRGIPSIRLLPPRFIHQLGDHLYSLGHRHIDCLNTQPEDQVIEQRMDQWALWQRMHKTEGRLIREPVVPYDHATPKAYNVIKRMLDAGEFKATGLVCLTNSTATGAIRAFQEHGMQVGRDVSVCAMEGETQAPYQWPSRTVLEVPEPDIYVQACVDWFVMGNEPWVGPYLVEPLSLDLFKGESTGPVRPV